MHDLQNGDGNIWKKSSQNHHSIVNGTVNFGSHFDVSFYVVLEIGPCVQITMVRFAGRIIFQYFGGREETIPNVEVGYFSHKRFRFTETRTDAVLQNDTKSIDRRSKLPFTKCSPALAR